jgi:hypothetical protein
MVLLIVCSSRDHFGRRLPIGDPILPHFLAIAMYNHKLSVNGDMAYLVSKVAMYA